MISYGAIYKNIISFRPDIAALQQRTGALSAMAALASRGSDSSSEPSAAAAAAAAAARQMSVDAEAIKIVIHDVDDRSPRRVSLRRDPNDKGHRCMYLLGLNSKFM